MTPVLCRLREFHIQPRFQIVLDKGGFIYEQMYHIAGNELADVIYFRYIRGNKQSANLIDSRSFLFQLFCIIIFFDFKIV